MRAAPSGFEVLATCSGNWSSELEMVDPASFLLGWLNQLPQPPLRPTITTFTGQVVELSDVDFVPGEVGEHMLVGVVAFPSGSGSQLHVTAAMVVLARMPAWRQWWEECRTVPSARLLSAILFEFEDDAHMALAKAVAVPFTPQAALGPWLLAKEATGTAAALPLDSKWRPLFLDARGGMVCMDVGTGEVAVVAAGGDVPTVRGGVLTGLPGAGKFRRLLEYIRADGSGPVAGVEGLVSTATLLLVPECSCQWRLRQVSTHFPDAVVLLTAAHFRSLTWHDILMAKVVIMSQGVFQAKWYTRLVQSFVANTYESPMEAVALLRSMTSAPKCKPKKRQRGGAAAAAAAAAEMSFFERPGGDRGTPLSSKTRAVSFQLASAGTEWQRVLTRPVMQVIHFARIVCADVQHSNYRQLEVMAQLHASVKWVTDASAVVPKWITQPDRCALWEPVLPLALHSLPSGNTKTALLLSMACELEPRPVVYRTQQDVVTPALRDQCRADDLDLRVTASCVCPQYRKLIVFLPPEEVVAAVLLEQERGLVARELNPPPPLVPTPSSSDDALYEDDSSYSGTGEDEEEEDDEGDASSAEDPAYAAAIAQSLADLGGAVRIPGITSYVSSPVVAAAVPAVFSAHEKEQLALAARVHATLRTEIGKEACKICAACLCSGLLSCGHAFCGACVFNWLETEARPSCPVCMRVFASSEPPFFVPLQVHNLPLPSWAGAEDSCLWARDVCGGLGTSAAFWCYCRLRAAEAVGQPLVLMVDTAAHVKALSETCGQWSAAGAVWKCGAYAGGFVSRQATERQFAARRQHVIITQKDIVSGCQLEGVTDVVNLCSEEVEFAAVALRLGHDTAIAFRSCVYSEAAP